MIVIWIFSFLFLSPTISYQGMANPMSLLRVIDRKDEFLKNRKFNKSSKNSFNTRSLIGNDFLNDYLKNGNEQHPDFQMEQPDVDFDQEGIQEAISFIEYKMTEMNAIITECINRWYEDDPMADPLIVKTECGGPDFQILIISYREGLKKVKEVLLEILKVKLLQFHSQYTEEITYFIDLVNHLIDCDFKLEDTLPVAKKASRYYVSSEIFDTIIGFAEEEIKAFSMIQTRFKSNLMEVQDLLDSHVENSKMLIESVEDSESNMEKRRIKLQKRMKERKMMIRQYQHSHLKRRQKK